MCEAEPRWDLQFSISGVTNNNLDFTAGDNQYITAIYQKEQTTYEPAQLPGVEVGLEQTAYVFNGPQFLEK